MLNKLRIAGQIARYILLVIATVRVLVVDAEAAFDGSGRGAEKFAAVLSALRIAARYLGISVEAITAAEEYVGDKIEESVSNDLES